MDATTNHQHQDGSPMQHPPPPSKKRKQHQVKRTKKSSFEKRMDDLRAYKEKHGHVNVKKSEDQSLYNFCNNMRRARKNPGKSTYIIITDERIASLDALGFEWNPDSNRDSTNELVFKQRIDNLRAYKEKHGHINVKEREDKSLYDFCKHMRKARNTPEKRRKVVLTNDRIASLDALGFDWSIKDQSAKKTFEQRMEDLRAYKEKHGHINVRKSDDNSLYDFCINIRHARNNPGKSKTLINDDRIASLDALGFDWSVSERQVVTLKSFEQRIEDLRSYRERHGHIRVKQSEDRSLSNFCRQIRCAHKNPEKSTVLINEERIASLDTLGFDWNMNSGIKSFAQQTDRPQPGKKRKQKGQGKLDTATKKKHVRPKCSAKNDKGCASSSDQMEALPVTVKDAAVLLDPLPTLGHSGNAVSVSPFAVSTTTALASDNMDTIDMTTDAQTESVKKHPTSLAGVLLEEKGKRLVQVKQEMAETQESLNDVREDLDIANDTVTQQAVFTDAWQNKFEELAKLAEVGKVDGAKISEIRNRSISTRKDEACGTSTNDESCGNKVVPV